jgi:hypothetical protein
MALQERMESTAFLKNRSKKLFVVLASASPDRLGPDSQTFASLFQNRTPSFLPLLPGSHLGAH